MAEFRFKIVCSDGERRTGTLSAQSYEAAKSALMTRAEAILELEETNGTPAGGWSSPEMGTGRRLWIGLSGALGLLFLLSSISLLTDSRSDSSARPTEKAQAFSFQVKGSLAQEPDRETRAHAVLPELPLEVEGELGEDGRSFLLPVEVKTVRRPNTVLLELSQDGRRWRVDGSRRPEPEGVVDFGVVPYDPPRVAPRKYRKPRRAYQKWDDPQAELARNKAERMRLQEKWRSEP